MGRIRVIRRDIASLVVDAIVNAANGGMISTKSSPAVSAHGVRIAIKACRRNFPDAQDSGEESRNTNQTQDCHASRGLAVLVIDAR